MAELQDEVRHLTEQNEKFTQENRKITKENRVNLNASEALQEKIDQLESTKDELARKMGSLDKLAKEKKREVEELNDRITQL